MCAHSPFVVDLLLSLHEAIPQCGRIYIAQPPLYKVEVAGGGKKKKKVQYAYSDEEMQGS